MIRRRPGRVRRALIRLLAGATVGALAGLAVAQAAPSATAAPAGSAVTVAGRGEFKDMRFTVDRTSHLTSQAIKVSWTGGTPTTFAGTSFNTDFVQIMQCWGDDDHSVPGNPGPPRTQCQYGASPTTDRGNWPGNQLDDTRQVFYSADPTNYGEDNRYGAAQPPGVPGEVPFKSVTGETVTTNTQNNRFFNHNTTNEVDFARTGANGHGEEYFEVQTANEAPHLGCGAPVSQNGVTKPRSCWLVIVPQGRLDLDGKPYADHSQVNAGSPVSSTNWQNRIAIPLRFNQVGSNCPLGSDERPTTGSELVADAVTSWQAALCPSGKVYGYTELGEPDTRSRLGTDKTFGLGFTTRALGADDGTSAPSGTTTYAPVALSGAVIGFTIERRPKAGAPEDIRKQAGTKVESIRLTPRLVAKLLTESYRNSTWGSVLGGKAAHGYGWAKNNPAGLASDPEFIALNPEFAYLSVAETPATDTDLMTALGHSDSARAVWQWILADKEARQFLSGVSDDWGMRVDPYYSTNADLNPSGLAFEPAHVDEYPKSDPWCTVPPGTDAPKDARQCMTDFHPYVDDMHAGALHTRRADTLWKSTWDPLSNPPAYRSPGPQTVGSRFVITVTDAASAERYGLQTARLRNTAGTFVAPTATALTEAAKSASGKDVAEITPANAKAKGAYPLAQLVYAAVRPGSLKADARADYAALLRYAAGAGQVSGADPGRLPDGYAPLSRTLRDRALRAADALLHYKGPHSTGGDSGSGGTGGADTSGGTGDGSGGATSGGTSGDGGTGADGGASATPSAQASYDGGKAVETTAAGNTPADPANPLRYAVPVGAALGAFAGLGAPFAGGTRLRLPLRVPLPGGRTVTVVPAFTLPERLRRRLP
ncbi:hypothetical protein [Streptomyces diastatochromogenes]|uniref:PBP domain-containing protein n=1 Tax=Streptomyces diastatochromogenes TaxID=42236 RepID=A0A233SSY7_STRDA|nr:hypothetical protein [Streptomyces diastatochromogenes]OXY98752.1 hypothetical protein BEK98_07930 [Streptomyces diastatochromogenes]